MASFEINFCDLKRDVQDALLQAMGLDNPGDANWDRENPIGPPIAIYETEDNDSENQE